MAVVTEAPVARMVRTIVAEVDPGQITPFSFRARGSHTDNSDVDLIVIQGDHARVVRSKWQEAVQLYKALDGFGVSKDILVYGSDDVEYWKDSLNYVLASWDSHGVLGNSG